MSNSIVIMLHFWDEIRALRFFASDDGYIKKSGDLSPPMSEINIC